MKVHGLVKLEEQIGNFPQFRWFVECKCGFQARVGTQEAARSQFNNHLVYHGNEPHFTRPVVTEEAPPLTPADSSGFTPVKPTGGGLKPVGGK